MKDFKPEEIEVTQWPKPRSGGMHVPIINNGVRIAHLGTGSAVECVTERSMYKNRERALKALEILVRDEQ